MNQIVLKGGDLITPTEERLIDLLITDGSLKLLVNELPGEDIEVVDVSGSYVTPGLIDLQVNGSPSCNLWGDPTEAEFAKLCRELLCHGVTSFFPTLITDELHHLRKNIHFLEAMASKDANLIRLAGIHVEGPFISKSKPGVHPLQYILPHSRASVEQILSPGVKIMTLAPEEPKAQDSIRLLHERGVVVSIGHSNANFEQGEAAIESGVTMMTHTFNALPPIHHRAPGPIAAALLDDRIWCCFICDGLHVDPDMLMLATRLKGIDRSILVTDSAFLGTTGGGLVGSSIFLSQGVKNLVDWKIATFRQAIQMATLNPACATGLSEKFGRIADGCAADLVVWDKATLEIKRVFVRGQLFLPLS